MAQRHAFWAKADPLHHYTPNVPTPGYADQRILSVTLSDQMDVQVNLEFRESDLWKEGFTEQVLVEVLETEDTTGLCRKRSSRERHPYSEGEAQQVLPKHRFFQVYTAEGS